MKRKMITIGLFALLSIAGFAQTKPADTVVIKVGTGSKLILAVQDKKIWKP